MDIQAWRIFESSGKISDYLAFKSDEELTSSDTFKSAEVSNNAGKNKGNCTQTTQYR